MSEVERIAKDMWEYDTKDSPKLSKLAKFTGLFTDIWEELDDSVKQKYRKYSEYVIKARIEELEKAKMPPDGFYSPYIRERIAELKKGLRIENEM